MTTSPQRPSRLHALRNVLSMEQREGYQARAVAGGFDRFLATLRREAVHDPALRALDAQGLLSIEYESVSAEQRRKWAVAVERVIGPPPTAPAPVHTRRPPPTPPPVPVEPVGLDDPLDRLPGVSRVLAGRLGERGVHTVRDLVTHYPLRHLDYSARRTVAQLQPGQEQTVVVSLWDARELTLGRQRRLRIAEATVGDETGNIRAVWFQQPWVAGALRRAVAGAGQAVKLAVSGKVSVFNGRTQLDSPEWEVLDDPETADLVHTGRLVPVYSKPDRTAARTMRHAVRAALDAVTVDGRIAIDDPLPDEERTRWGLMALPEAIAQAHYPDSPEAKEEARRRLAFDELLVLQLAIAGQRPTPAEVSPGVALPPRPPAVDTFIASLPFTLTEGQQRTLEEAWTEMATGARPMSRLLQGDVGAGKTVVAVALLLTAVAAGYQGALMAPTEVLAEQHFISVRRLLGGLEHWGGDANWFAVALPPLEKPVTVGLLTGSTRSRARQALAAQAAEGGLDILIGTHAVIQDNVDIPNLAFAVVDEQHRFGVLQRQALRAKGRDPHLLLMSATPIPRTLALTLYGELEVSSMRELPSGRQEVMTRIVPGERSEDAERFIAEQVDAGHQAFIVCPLIDESEAVLARAATTEYERLRTTTLAGVRVELLHGRMPLAEKQAVMESFRSGEVDVLVSTPVIEVGIDVPNATVMLIQAADRFGLAQLHQLRGRVGRGTHASYCFLLAETASEEARQRLEVLVRTNDGFEIAEADLRLRGPGDFFGTRQSGLPTLRHARLDDRDLLESARAEARELLAGGALAERAPGLAEAVARYRDSVAQETA
ncbi:MAG: ATP-dependent DNA helicase RecG [Chloroflexota bacterium]